MNKKEVKDLELKIEKWKKIERELSKVEQDIYWMRNLMDYSKNLMSDDNVIGIKFDCRCKNVFVGTGSEWEKDFGEYMYNCAVKYLIETERTYKKQLEEIN